MSNPVVIVDPISSGVELADAFKARGVPCIAVRSSKLLGSQNGRYGSYIRKSDFLQVYDNHPGLLDELRKHNPHAIIAGSEAGVLLADTLASRLTPKFANIPNLSLARRHKGEMQKVLAEHGLPIIRTLNTACLEEASNWLFENNLLDKALVLKPPLSMSSDQVIHIPKGGDWKQAFNSILATPTVFLQEVNKTVIIQEEVTGTEYSVDTVSVNGKHELAHLTRYKKVSVGEGVTVIDHTEFIPFDSYEHKELFDYTQKALDALGILWGAAHSEIMLTNEGPRLIETGARMCGGPIIGFARAATGSSQLERVIEAYLDEEIRTLPFELKQTVVPVFLRAKASGIIRNVEVLESLKSLPTYLSTHVWPINGDTIKRTVDFASILGFVTLSGEREIVFEDYKKVRSVEAQLIVE